MPPCFVAPVVLVVLALPLALWVFISACCRAPPPRAPMGPLLHATEPHRERRRHLGSCTYLRDRFAASTIVKIAC